MLTKFAYRPCGTNAAPPTPFGYTGQRFDQESGLYYYRARHYSTVLGRFMQPDPIGYEGGLNLYAYVGNDPLNLTDPTGFFAQQAALQAVTQANSARLVTGLQMASAGSSQPTPVASPTGPQPIELAGLGTSTVNPDPSSENEDQSAWDITDPFSWSYPCQLASNGPCGPKAGGGGGGRSVAPRASGSPTINFKPEYYANRLQNNGIDINAATQAVRNQILGGINNIAPGAPFVGRLQVNGVLLEYRAFRLPSGQIDVGTIFKVQ